MTVVEALFGVATIEDVVDIGPDVFAVVASDQYSFLISCRGRVYFPDVRTRADNPDLFRVNKSVWLRRRRDLFVFVAAVASVAIRASELHRNEWFQVALAWSERLGDLPAGDVDDGEIEAAERRFLASLSAYDSLSSIPDDFIPRTTGS